MNKNIVFLLLGSNIEPRMNYLREAEKLINQRLGNAVSASSVYETEAWGYISENAYLNKLISVETTKDAFETLEILIETEQFCNRQRTGSDTYSDRTLDADIIYFNEEIINTDKLTIPHPRLQLRRFVLEPLCEIAADFIHPILKFNSLQLLEKCTDNTKVEKF
ncbi:MAG: 2-amino-4-hydroxy-6-hydroxymethyldihydropteridine diphosphokinase [Chlorobi bacterium]|nr:2-amino-4-hydroxy-6-hydroxymethyldihydropteridine diphosphokinase [Chlorobiota bacterium]